MRNLNAILVALGAFIAGAAGTWLFTRAPTRANAPASAATAEKKVLYWYDPMQPQQHFDAPGKSPFMDMQLVPKYAGGDAGAEAGTVNIDSRMTQNLGVRTARAERGALTHRIRATGTLAFDERAITSVQSRVAGIVQKLWVRVPLSPVKRGEALVTLLAPDWTAAQEEYLSLRRSKASGLDSLRTAAYQRLLLFGMDEGQIRAAERAGRAQMQITITAPHDGVISELAVREGASVTTGAPIMTLSGLDTVWMNAAISETDIGRVAPGSKVTATIAAFPGESFEGQVETLLPDLDPVTRTQKARVVLANPKHQLAPGMFASVEIARPTATATHIIVPGEAVIVTGKRNVVIVDTGSGKFRAQEVRIGEEAGGKTIILDGLKQGEAVVLSGQFLIDSEASLNGTLARLGSSGATSSSSAPASEGANAKTQHLATGKVVRIDGHRWTIAADAIPSLEMGAMTMTFICPTTVPASDIKPGQRVSFSFFRNSAGEFEIAKIAVVDEAHVPKEQP